ncbi:MAG: methyltransferase domain-containing protein [Lachnospiraceae bacterium]|nr:methyltransferase domain-containing protein [Lachnospiraceae bacterium]
MIKELYGEICAGREIRANLISLRRELKTEENQRKFAYLLGGDFHVLTRLLQSDDPKVRKNAALILGDMETEDLLPFLFAAYQKEETLFVRTDYLKAMERLDYGPYLEKLKSRREELKQTVPSEENRKHVREELVQLQNMILKQEKPRKHTFIGYEPAPEVILVTNRNQREATKSQITEGQVTELGQGVKIRNGNLKELMRIRTYTELLFPLPSGRALSGKPEEIGAGLAKLGIADFLENLHKTGGCFYYRMEIKGPMAAEKKGDFIRKAAERLDGLSGGRLWNTAADYEVELRLLEKKDGSFLPMLKLYTLPDRRFAYRKEAVASSISPVNAALTVRLTQNYMKEGAQILDPFCGVGTMLLERNRAVHAEHMYGLDIFGEAIEKARRNTERDGSTVHYINRDFFDFTHTYLFDEIITDMPRSTDSMELGALYHRFFDRAYEFLKEDGILILYTMNPELTVRELNRHSGFQKKEEFLLNEKNLTKVYVIGKIGR